MTVSSILADKGPDVVTVSPEETLLDVTKLLDKHKIGAVLATDSNGKLAGIISERDVVRAVARGGPEALGEAVGTHMTKKVVTCKKEDRVNSVMMQMTEGKFRHVPVIDGGKIAGIISIGDVVRRRIADIETEWRAMQDYIAAG
ncbi:CBS domain-containing protein [Tepidamorphus sp. 3E244]|uniref:CBS domain-containing protein n=1 Tax=Tepidamorphus sp. 3E244 TaxID=3385498 RepID=UPI0038FBF9FA